MNISLYTSNHVHVSQCSLCFTKQCAHKPSFHDKLSREVENVYK